MFENESILICSKSIDEAENGTPVDYYKEFDIKSMDYLNIKLPPRNKKLKRIQIHFFGIQIVPLSRSKQLIRQIINIDMRLKIVPISFVNWCNKKFSTKMIGKILDKAG